MTLSPDQEPVFAPAPAELIARAAGELRRGLPVIVTGDGGPLLAAAASFATPRLMAAFGAAPQVLLSPSRAQTLKIRLYTEGAVAVPVPAGDHALVQALADPARDLDHPMKGPFAAARTPLAPAAHAAAKLMRLADLLPAALIAPAPETGRDALVRIAAADVLDHDPGDATAVVPLVRARLPLADAPETEVVSFRVADGAPEPFALIIGTPQPGRLPLVRLHSECLTGDLLGSLKCDCGEQLRGALRAIAAAGHGILLYLRQEGRGIGLTAKLRAYRLQDQGFDTVEANLRLGFGVDERDWRVAATMLKALGAAEIRLLTNNPEKVAGLNALGIHVAERVPHAFQPNPHNAAYLAAKAQKTGHWL